jgi:hypothetical protein
VTPAREHSDAFPVLDIDGPDWSQRSAFGSRGVPWWAAVLLAALPTAIGTAIDVDASSGKPGAWFTGCYVVGCMLAIVLVQRRSVFGPMVQPPLVLAIVMPLIVVLSGHNPGGGRTGQLLSVAFPLISSFPAMGSTTAVAIVIGLLRIYLQRLPSGEPGEPDEDMRPTKRTPAKETRTGARQTPPDRAAGRRQPRDVAGAGRARSGADSQNSADKQGERAGGGSPGRARAGEGAPKRGDRAVPPGRGSGGRQASGAPQQAAPQRRPRRPPREDLWDR